MVNSNTFIWVAFEVEIVQLDESNQINSFCQTLYRQLNSLNIDVLYDDRPERSGVKFKDMDLIGIPINVIVGSKNFKNDKIEIRLRHTKEKILCDKDKCIDEIISIRNNMYESLEAK